MPIHYEDNTELNRMIQQLMKKHHSRVLDAKVKVKGLLKCKFKDEEIVKAQAEPVKLVKVNPIFRDTTEADFIVMVDNEFWSTGDPRDREPRVNFALCAITVENTESGPKVKVRRPDIVDYSENIRTFGAYSAPLHNVLEFARGTAGSSAAHVLTTVERLLSGKGREESAPAPDAGADAEAEAPQAPQRPVRPRRPAPVAPVDEEVLPEETAPAASEPATDEDESVPTAVAPAEEEGEETQPAPPPPPRRPTTPRIR